MFLSCPVIFLCASFPSLHYPKSWRTCHNTLGAAGKQCVSIPCPTELGLPGTHSPLSFFPTGKITTTRKFSLCNVTKLTLESPLGKTGLAKIFLHLWVSAQVNTLQFFCSNYCKMVGAGFLALLLPQPTLSSSTYY